METSIIIPTFNRPKKLKECLESITKNTESNYEIIVVDDGSKKNYSEVITEFQDRVNFIINTENKGPAGARNDGAKAANGNFLLFLDDDCTTDTNSIEKLVQPLKNGGADITVGKILPKKNNTWIEKSNTATESMKMSDISIQSGHICFSKETFDEINFDKDFEKYKIKTGEDVELTYRIKKAGKKIQYVSDASIFHNYREGLFSFIKQKYEYGKGAYFHCMKSKRDFSELGHPDPNLFGMTKTLFSYVFKDLPKKYKTHKENGFSKKQAFQYCLTGFIRRASLYAGMLKAKHKFKKNIKEIIKADK